jgi:heme/copper-type cytochrome/quinol oxidase subunit 3
MNPISAPSRARDDANGLLLALMMAIGGMLFAAFSASYVIRRTGADWVGVPMPWIAWVSTALVLACSGAVEMARRRPAPWMSVTMTLGVAFVASQTLVWVVIASGGAFSTANPHRAFLLMLTAVHAAHVVAALVLTASAAGPRSARRAGLCAGWWHFVDAVWLYLAALLWLF